jgi:hypothetical protein
LHGYPSFLQAVGVSAPIDMLRPMRSLLVAALLLAASACVTDSPGCPRAGLDSSRRCKRLCVVSPGQPEAPLPCACVKECLCWQMSGHVARGAAR